MSTALPTHAEIVIVGGGIAGCSTAYHLAKLGTTKVLVVDKGYLCGGASGRNGGGVRAQWSTHTFDAGTPRAPRTSCCAAVPDCTAGRHRRPAGGQPRRRSGRPGRRVAEAVVDA